VAAKSVDAFPFVRRAWEIIFSGRVSTCAHEALKLGYLRGPPATFILPDATTLVGHAKEHVLESISQGWHPAEPRGAFPCLGTAGIERFAELIDGLLSDGKITAHDAAVGRESAWVLCGGARKAGTRITEQGVLDLEREAFLRLCGLPPTLERIRHMLETGKPLKN
jgi:3-hydroxyacyl-CoA dehydrogenase